MSAPGRLEGLGVVLTRPHAAAEALAAPLAREGARVFLFPALAIEDLKATPALTGLISRLGEFDMAIFVSANAVEKGLAAARRAGAWPARMKVAAIGEATAQALRSAGIAEVIAPAERHDSEALLGLAELQVVKGRNIIVFRGEGGREHLKEVLEARGARVEYAECYRRVRPRGDAAPLAAALARGEVHAVSALSAETLTNFVAMIGPDAAAALAPVTLVVPHVAVGSQREARRFARVVIAAHGPEGLINALTPLRVTP
jgi:uroporphyrinogen-III synthase